MFLYINGDSHTAAGEAVNNCVYASDDYEYFYLGRAAHPDNLKVSWGKKLSEKLKCPFYCDAEGASSNARIIRTTKKWLDSRKANENLLLIIGWATWERTEWYRDGEWFQINGASPVRLPEKYHSEYQQWLVNIDIQSVTDQAHEDIWQFHLDLLDRKINHVFFNCVHSFSSVKNRRDWGRYYINPYENSASYSGYVESQGYYTVSPQSTHYGADAHSAWSNYLLKYLIANNFV